MRLETDELETYRNYGHGTSADVEDPGDLMGSERVTERMSSEMGQLVMPFYLICDTSYSMQADMSALNIGVSRLCQAIVTEPVVDDVAQISIISFSDTARVLMPLGQVSESVVPTLSVEGGTNYGAAFRLLAQSIDEDYDCLRRQGYKIYRPCAFFLTDGEPGDTDWYRTFIEQLTYDRGTGHGFKMYPTFVPFGFRDATPRVLSQLAYPRGSSKWYLAREHDVEKALDGILGIIMQTVVISGGTAHTGRPAIVQPSPKASSAIVMGNSENDHDYL